MSDAFYPWLPTLQDIEQRKHDDPFGYYSKFGWDQLEVPDSAVHVKARMSQLKTLFDERYGFRMVNQETLERWQIGLQRRFDELVNVYERAYTLYEMYDQDLLDDAASGELREWQRSYASTESSEGVTSKVDTPDSVINKSGDYADSRQSSTGGGSSSGTDTVTERKISTGDALIDSVNESYRKWRDIDAAFVREFENNFLNMFW